MTEYFSICSNFQLNLDVLSGNHADVGFQLLLKVQVVFLLLFAEQEALFDRLQDVSARIPA